MDGEFSACSYSAGLIFFCLWESRFLRAIRYSIRSPMSLISNLKDIKPLARFNERLTELWNYPRVSIPSVAAGQLFYSKNTGLQRQAPIFMRAGLTAPPALVIDPNVISEDGSLSLAQYEPSPDASLLAYALSEGGADWQTIKVRQIATHPCRDSLTTRF